MQGLLDSGGGSDDDEKSVATLGPGMGLTEGSGPTDQVVQPDPGPANDGYDGPVITNQPGGGQSPVHRGPLAEVLAFLSGVVSAIQQALARWT